jgi:hypothetical protein
MSGAPTPDPYTDRDLKRLERMIADQIAQQFSQRLAVHMPSREIFLAKTVQRSSSYPSSGDTFSIRLLDAYFSSLTPGSTTMTTTERTSESDAEDAADVTAREINGQYLPEGTHVFAMWQRGSQDPGSYGEWWISAGDTRKRWCRFTLSAAMTTSDSSKSATIHSQIGPGVAHTTTSITVNNLLTSSSGVYLFEGASGAAGLAVFDSGTTWQIVNMECPAT